MIVTVVAIGFVTALGIDLGLRLRYQILEIFTDAFEQRLSLVAQDQALLDDLVVEGAGPRHARKSRASQV